MVKKIASFNYGKAPFSAILDYDDLFQEGVIGYMEAERTFDSTRNVPFNAYATMIVRNRITDARREALPQKRRKDFHPEVFSIETPVFIEGNSQGTFKDTLEDASSNQHDEIYIRQLRETLMPLVERLSPRRKAVIQHIFFEGKDGMILARRWGVGVSCIAVHKLKALRQLKQWLLKEGFKG